MRIAILSCGSIIVREKEQSWLFGAPDGIKQALDSAGIDMPQVLFTTSLRSPGYKDLGPILRFKETPLSMNGVSAVPVVRKHGTDYTIDAGHTKILYSERGDVSVEDTEGYHLAIIKNKHRADAFGEHVITWPWKDSEFVVQDGIVTPLSQEIQLKIWSSLEEVPSNLKSLDGASLSLEQANSIARIAKASSDNGSENWAIGISVFKNSHKKDGDKWVKAEETQEKDYVNGKPVANIADILTAALHKAYNDTSDKLFQIGYINQDERMKIAGSIGDGLSAFRKAIESDEFARREVDKWDADQFMEISKDESTYVNVFKSKDDDTWRWVAITSAAVWDKQGELLSTKAMDWAIGFSKMLNRMTGKNALGPLRYKHIPGFDGGVCDTQLRVGDFLFEAGTFDDTPIGLAMRQKMIEDPAIWQISPGLAFAKNDLQNGVYQRAAIFERSMTQRPANPFTIVITNKEQNEADMKILTEQELKSAAEELGLDFEEAKMMYERAMAAGSGPLGLKEFTEVVTKATGTNASGFPGGANSTADDEDEDEEDGADALKEAVEDLSEEELKHLAELVQTTMKEKGMAADEDETSPEDEVEDEVEANGKKKMPPMMKKAKKEDADLTSLLLQQSQLIVQQTKALNDLVATLSKPVDDGLSRRQQQNFASVRTKSTQPLTEDAAVLQRLSAIETQLKEHNNGQRNSGNALYDQFTSTKLNNRGK